MFKSKIINNSKNIHLPLLKDVREPTEHFENFYIKGKNHAFPR